MSRNSFTFAAAELRATDYGLLTTGKNMRPGNSSVPPKSSLADLVILAELLLVSGRPKDALAMLIESGDNSVAVGFAEIVIAGFRPTSCQCIVQVRGL